jgi:TPR repeat protein
MTAFALANGDGVEKDRDLSDTYYRKSHQIGCDAGRAVKCAKQGHMWCRGAGGPRDHAGAFVLFVRGCNGGSALGCYYAGALHYNGKGAPLDLAAARNFYTRACDVAEPELDDRWGVEWGCAALAQMLHSGEGGPVEEARAQRAADRACSSRKGRRCPGFEAKARVSKSGGITIGW